MNFYLQNDCANAIIFGTVEPRSGQIQSKQSCVKWEYASSRSLGEGKYIYNLTGTTGTCAYVVRITQDCVSSKSRKLPTRRSSIDRIDLLVAGGTVAVWGY